MKLVFSLAFIVSATNAHYSIPRLAANGVSTTDWQVVRKTANYQNVNPITDINSQAMTCYELEPGSQGADVLDVTAGGQITFTISPNIYHPGPVDVYMAKSPSGNVLDFDGQGEVWFKVYEDEPEFVESGLKFPSENAETVTITLPKCLSNGEYLIRFEHMAIHQAWDVGGAQFYLSCGQVRVSGGTGTAEPTLLSFPGAYDPNDPNILINIHWPVPTNYTNPGGRPVAC